MPSFVIYNSDELNKLLNEKKVGSGRRRSTTGAGS